MNQRDQKNQNNKNKPFEEIINKNIILLNKKF